MNEPTARPMLPKTTPERCAMLELGPHWLAHLSHDSARRITRVGIVPKTGYDAKHRDMTEYVVELKYLLPSGYESTVESIRFDGLTDAKVCLETTMVLLKQAAGFC